MSVSRRETLIVGIVDALEAIMGDASYNYGTSLKSVQRKLHTWDGEFAEVNETGDSPCILVHPRQESASSSEGSISDWLNTITVDLYFVIFGGAANDTEINAALADMKRALFANWKGVNLFGVNATVIRWLNQPNDPERAMPQDGIIFSLEIQYEDAIGNPELE